MDAGALQFFIRTKAGDGAPVVRRLSTNGSLADVYNGTWLQCVDSIDYDLTFPGATLHYRDGILPVEVTGQFFSPVIPHDLKTSGTPGAYIVFTLRNTSDKTQEVSLAAYLRNPLAMGGNITPDARKLRTTVATDQGTTYLTMRTDSTSQIKSTLGSMCLSINGGEPRGSRWISANT